MIEKKDFSRITSHRRLQEARFEVEIRLQYHRRRLRERCPILFDGFAIDNTWERLQRFFSRFTLYYGLFRRGIDGVREWLHKFFSKDAETPEK